MNVQSAEIFLRCHQNNRRDQDPRIQKAVKMAGRHEELKAKLAEQEAFDGRLLHGINAIAVPAGLPEKLDACVPLEERTAFEWRAAMKQPPFLAVVIGLLFMAGWGVFFAWNRMQSFPGKENAARLVEMNDEMSGMELEPKAAELGKLEDWLFSKYGFEDFYVPPALVNYRTVGGRVFKQDGVSVAQLAIEKNNMICYMFPAEDLGVKLDPEDHWKVFVDDEWVAAVQQHEESCFMIAFRGKRADMAAFLSSLH